MSEQRVTQAAGVSVPLPWVAPPGAFRLVLAFAVVASHVSAFDIGRLAVVLFFYLSGYWTARIWREKFDGRRTGWFYLSRYWRIAPLFLLATFGAAALRGWPLHWDNFTLLGVGSTDHDPTGVAWSLDVELQFYLLLPLVVGVLTAAPRAALVACLALSALGCWLDAAFQITTVAKFLPAFALGSLTYAKDWKPSRRAAGLSVAAFFAFSLLTMATPFFLSTDVDPFDHDIWALMWMTPLLPYVAHSLTIRSTRRDRHFGNLSYPLYLVHYATIALITSALGHGLLIKALAAAMACAIALALYWLVDRPVDRIRVRVTEGA
jgi:peptidoglycan/LPS O-acetylase OafA/YrhL